MRRSNRRKRSARWPQVPRWKFRIPWKALLIMPAIVGAVFGLASATRFTLDRPVDALVVEGTFRRVTPIQVEAALDEALDGTFLSLDLERLKDEVAAIDWVDTVQLAREWPDILKVRITEHQAAASWDDSGLLNVRGELFTRDARFSYAELPKLAGPDGSERRVAAIYLGLKGRLADANLTLASLRMDARGAFRILLASGPEVRFGRRELEDRLDRFFDVVVPALAGELDKVRYIDLRYTNGFAVGWNETRRPQSSLLRETVTRG